MKKNILLALVAGLVVLAGFRTPTQADTGWDGATRKEVGRYPETGRVYGSSVAGTEFMAATKNRPDGMYFNNTSSVIWIGTTTATRNNQHHDNILIGFPILSSATFSLNGAFSGATSFTCDREVAVCEVRKFEGRVP